MASLSQQIFGGHHSCLLMVEVIINLQRKILKGSEAGAPDVLSRSATMLCLGVLQRDVLHGDQAANVSPIELFCLCLSKQGSLASPVSIVPISISILLWPHHMLLSVKHSILQVALLACTSMDPLGHLAYDAREASSVSSANLLVEDLCLSKSSGRLSYQCKLFRIIHPLDTQSSTSSANLLSFALYSGRVSLCCSCFFGHRQLMPPVPCQSC